jgi:hypothetical protein
MSINTAPCIRENLEIWSQESESRLKWMSKVGYSEAEWAKNSLQATAPLAASALVAAAELGAVGPPEEQG